MEYIEYYAVLRFWFWLTLFVVIMLSVVISSIQINIMIRKHKLKNQKEHANLKRELEEMKQ